MSNGSVCFGWALGGTRDAAGRRQLLFWATTQHTKDQSNRTVMSGLFSSLLRQGSSGFSALYHQETNELNKA